MLDDQNSLGQDHAAEASSRAQSGPPPAEPPSPPDETGGKKTTKRPAKKATAKGTSSAKTQQSTQADADTPAEGATAQEAAESPAAKQAPEPKTAKKAAAKRPAAKKAAKKAPVKKATAEDASDGRSASPTDPTAAQLAAEAATEQATRSATEATTPVSEQAGPPLLATSVLFQAPDPTAAPTREMTAEAADRAPQGAHTDAGTGEPAPAPSEQAGAAEPGDGETGSGRRRRRRGGRRRRKTGAAAEEVSGGEVTGQPAGATGDSTGGDAEPVPESGHEGSASRRRRRRRRTGEEGEVAADDPDNTVTRVRSQRTAEDEITALTGSTRLEAKKQRRREGREAGRRRAPIVSEAEFLARRESVDRVMVVRQRDDLTQIAVLEDDVLVEHYVSRESQTSMIGNVYLGRVQNVLPSMEAAFIDIGKGRNAVLYAGEVNWNALGAKDGPRKIEQVLSSGQSVLVQVTKDPVGHKGARLTSQISLPGRFLVYVPDGTTSGISRKLPDTERNRLKALLKKIVPDTAGVIVRTAAEGASEKELTRDVERLTARWADIEAKANGAATPAATGSGNGGTKSGKGARKPATPPALLYGEPDLTLKVVRDLFTEDFHKLVMQGDDAWDLVQGYVDHVAPDLADRLERSEDGDVFATYRIDEQIAKGLERKVWLPSGGSLVIDRTEAMTVVDVNTGKFTGSGGNLEETVTKNNLEAAEEIVRQLRLRDIGGIIVIDFIDMVLESNRDLVLRRLVECLGRDRTRHQVAEVTSLGLVQMTRKRIGTGLLEAFSEPCEHCDGRGVIIHHDPVDKADRAAEQSRRSRRSGGKPKTQPAAQQAKVPSPADIAAMPRPEPSGDERELDEREPDEREPEGQGAGPGHRAGTAPPAEATPVEPPSDQAEATEEQPSDGAQVPPTAAEAADGDQPKVVSRVRRRSVRAAGPPAEPETASLDASPRPADEEADEEAGSQDGGSQNGAPPAKEPAPATAHVPIKKKGSRRR
jgi:ribonuclease E